MISSVVFHERPARLREAQVAGEPVDVDVDRDQERGRRRRPRGPGRRRRRGGPSSGGRAGGACSRSGRADRGAGATGPRRLPSRRRPPASRMASHQSGQGLAEMAPAGRVRTARVRSARRASRLRAGSARAPSEEPRDVLAAEDAVLPAPRARAEGGGRRRRARDGRGPRRAKRSPSLARMAFTLPKAVHAATSATSSRSSGSRSACAKPTGSASRRAATSQRARHGVERGVDEGLAVDAGAAGHRFPGPDHRNGRFGSPSPRSGGCGRRRARRGRGPASGARCAARTTRGVHRIVAALLRRGHGRPSPAPDAPSMYSSARPRPHQVHRRLARVAGRRARPPRRPGPGTSSAPTPGRRTRPGRCAMSTRRGRQPRDVR